MYNLEEDRIIEEIKKLSAKRVLLQLPEGLKAEASRLVNLLEEKTDASIFVSGQACWGACDLPIDEARTLDANLIVHFGHAPFHKPDFPILYVETRYECDITPFIQKNLETFKKFKKVALVASVQHLHQIPILQKILEKEGLEVTIPKGLGRSFYDGQILGCEPSGPKLLERDVDAYLSIANQFHTLAITLSTEKPVLLLDPVHEQVKDLQPLKEQIIRKRFAVIEKAKQANSFGILVSLKSGQLNTVVAENLKKKITDKDKEAIIITMKEFQPDELLNFGNIDVFVITACPRVAIEDQPRYGKPVLTLKELFVVLGELSWEDNLKQGFITAPYGAK
tara:strand:+ start:60951 stop:61961 length:1011 start_codon:yes stop_codon:yes gene_type:complete